MGAIFENLVIGEIIKAQANKGIRPDLYFFRDSNGSQVDLLIPRGSGFVAVEIKSAATYRQSLLKGLKRIEAIAPEVASRYLIYRGERRMFSNGIEALPYDEAASVV